MTAQPRTDLFRLARPDRVASAARGARPAADTSRHEIDETYWGYIVRSNAPVPTLTAMVQSLALVLGLFCLVATAGLWLIEPGMADAATLGLRLGASMVLAGIGTMLLWYSARGTAPEVQFDCAMGEVREVVRNRSGRPTLVARYGFDAIGGVFIARSKTAGKAALVLRYRNTAQVMKVTVGTEAGLVTLRDRIGRDLMVRPKRSQPAVPPVPSRLMPLAAPG